MSDTPRTDREYRDHPHEWTGTNHMGDFECEMVSRDFAAGLERELAVLGRICGESYQVMGILASEAGRFNDPAVVKALDNLSRQELEHEDVLPFPCCEQPLSDPYAERRAFPRATTWPIGCEDFKLDVVFLKHLRHEVAKRRINEDGLLSLAMLEDVLLALETFEAAQAPSTERSALEADRDEWKAQHENLLAVREADVKRLGEQLEACRRHNVILNDKAKAKDRMAGFRAMIEENKRLRAELDQRQGADSPTSATTDPSGEQEKSRDAVTTAAPTLNAPLATPRVQSAPATPYAESEERSALPNEPTEAMYVACSTVVDRYAAKLIWQRMLEASRIPSTVGRKA